VQNAKPSVNGASFTGQTQERFFCEMRRLWRLGRLVAHVIVGTVIAHGVFGVLTLTTSIAIIDTVAHWCAGGATVCCALSMCTCVSKGKSPLVRCCTPPTIFPWLDIPCLRAVVDAAFVAKDEVRRWPVIGRMSEQAARSS